MYALVVRPQYIALLFFTITVADINFEMGGLPLNVRAIIGLSLFFRTLIMGKSEDEPRMLANLQAWKIVILALYLILITAFYELLNMEVVKQQVLTLIAVYCGWRYFFLMGNMRLLKISLIISGIICFSDLVFTYATYSAFPVQRVYHFLLGIPSEVDEDGKFIEVINHNFYGLICGMAFVLIINDFINQKKTQMWLLAILPIMFLGVLMSTSRSTLLGLIVASIFLVVREIRKGKKVKRAYMLVTMAAGIIFLCLLVFTTMQSLFNLSNDFLDGITMRLVDEPIAVFNKTMGLNYNVNSLDAMDWRKEAASDAFDAWMALDFREQVFGIGFWGFVDRDLGHTKLPPHNGILFLLFDVGLFGLILYVSLIYKITRTSIQVNENISPLVSTLLFVLFYCIGQNGELTSSITFLFVITLIAENELIQINKRKGITEDNPYPDMELA